MRRAIPPRLKTCTRRLDSAVETEGPPGDVRAFFWFMHSPLAGSIAAASMTVTAVSFEAEKSGEDLIIGHRPDDPVPRAPTPKNSY
ncbi:MAG: hypothetical protein OQK79_10960 [Rhodanobacter sp.]|jgi:hypothetical protein|nr:hypothetical protein [Rhodanobacter sp.]